MGIVFLHDFIFFSGMINARYKFLASTFFLLFFAACNSQENITPEEFCQKSILEISANLPQKEGIRTLYSQGFFVKKNTLLTVSHAIPPNASSIFKVQKRDEKRELLLLKSPFCGSPLPLSSDPLLIGSKIFDCQSQEKRGIIDRFSSAVSSLPLASGEKQMKNLAALTGTFFPGESGRPFCDQKGAVLGILVAVSRQEGFLIPHNVISSFLSTDQ